jgi:lysylphosphatidylglycerol synthetase-like protein (DUF2156 family)
MKTDTTIHAAKQDIDIDSSIMDNSLMTWALMPCLLLIQFGMPFYWPLVNFVIVLYVSAVWIYRQACMDSDIDSLVMLLLPGLLMDIVLALILFNRVVIALAALLDHAAEYLRDFHHDPIPFDLMDTATFQI